MVFSGVLMDNEEENWPPSTISKICHVYLIIQKLTKMFFSLISFKLFTSHVTLNLSFTYIRSLFQKSETFGKSTHCNDNRIVTNFLQFLRFLVPHRFVGISYRKGELWSHHFWLRQRQLQCIM